MPETEAVPGLLSNLSSSVTSPLSQAPIPSPVAKLSAHTEVEAEDRQLPVGPLTQLLLEELPTTDNPSFMETPRPAMLIGMPSTPYFPSLTASAQANLQVTMVTLHLEVLSIGPLLVYKHIFMRFAVCRVHVRMH